MRSRDFNPDKVLIFDLMGPMAHFRKYYTNSSSLSYLIPPRTVITGLIAGLLGLPSEKHTKRAQETYYEKFNDKNCFVSVSLKSRIRRMIQKVNYIATDKDKFAKKSLNYTLELIEGRRNPAQIPLEILVPEDSNHDVVYRIYFYHPDEEEIYNKLKKRLINQSFIYPPYLGLSEFLASIQYIDEGVVEASAEEKIELDSACRLSDFELNFGVDDIQYLTEKMPVNFLCDRTAQKPDEYVIEAKGKRIKGSIRQGCIAYSVAYYEDNIPIKNCIMPM